MEGAKQPLEAGKDGKIVLEKLAAGGFVPPGFDTSKGIDFTDEQLQKLTSLGFITLSNAVLRIMERQRVTLEEADRWAEATVIVYGQWLRRADVGMLVHAAFTAGIFLTKEKLPPKPEGGASGKSDGKPKD